MFRILCSLYYRIIGYIRNRLAEHRLQAHQGGHSKQGSLTFYANYKRTPTKYIRVIPMKLLNTKTRVYLLVSFYSPIIRSAPIIKPKRT